jgi:hypothetical protein
MSEGETEEPVTPPPPLGDQTADASLSPPSADELLRRSDLALFVGPNVEKFASVFGSAGGRRRRRWTCWPGFFFPLAWFMYRKMYGWAALACALPIFAGVLDFGVFQRLLMSAPSFIGLSGRLIYAVQVRRTIARIRAAGRGQPEEELRQALVRAGGVSAAGAIVGGAIMVCALVIGVMAGLKARHP